MLSLEITNIARDQGFHFLEDSINVCDTCLRATHRQACLREKHRQEGECIIDVPGSKSTAGKRTVYIGTWENHTVSDRSSRQTEEASRSMAVW